jgi:hypothetical protein
VTRLVLCALPLAGCGDDQGGFSSFDAGIPEDGGPWVAGEVLTCGHDPLPTWEDGSTRWDMADGFDGRFSVGQNWVIPPGAEAIWSVPDLAEGTLDAAADTEVVAHAIRTNPEFGFVGRDAVVGVDVLPLDGTVHAVALSCRMTPTDPPEHHYSAVLLPDRFELREDAEVKVGRDHAGFAADRGFRLILSCLDRESDTLVSAFLYEVVGGTANRLGCIWTLASTALESGVAAIGVDSGTAHFDDFRMLTP